MASRLRTGWSTRPDENAARAVSIAAINWSHPSTVRITASSSCITITWCSACVSCARKAIDAGRRCPSEILVDQPLEIFLPAALRLRLERAIEHIVGEIVQGPCAGDDGLALPP